MFGGKIALRIDGQDTEHLWDRQKKTIWNGAMLEGVPNMMFAYGYTNNVWTVGVDITAWKLVRVCRYMDKRGFKRAVPRDEGRKEEGEEEGWCGMWRLTATYVREVEDGMPRYRTTGRNWTARECPPLD
ncbi:hypothetical protein F5Y17DRAFT_460434 [Xylariaceae sp. FL0594]|nr:hypothetical protein F5Y17DRAFT_460434 [Xylariaceae sp. FL0594]